MVQREAGIRSDFKKTLKFIDTHKPLTNLTMQLNIPRITLQSASYLFIRTLFADIFYLMNISMITCVHDFE